MVYYAHNKVLKEIRTVYSGVKNDVLICQDMLSPVLMYYTLMVIKNRSCAKEIIQIYERAENVNESISLLYGKCFAQNETLCYIYPYRSERHISFFLEGQMQSLYDREQTALNLTMEALVSPHPYPLLYLLLKQHEIHIHQDNSIFFTDYFHLDLLDETKTQSDCAMLCAVRVLEILEMKGSKTQKSIRLIRKKMERNAYRGLPELYRDIHLTASPQNKMGLMKYIAAWFVMYKDLWFRVLLAVCMVVTVIAAGMLICQLIWGDIGFFKLFQHSFDVIGTQKLTQ